MQKIYAVYANMHARTAQCKERCKTFQQGKIFIREWTCNKKVDTLRSHSHGLLLQKINGGFIP